VPCLKKERYEKRKAIIEAQRAAKAVKKRFRHNQAQYLRRKAVKVALVKGEAEAYKASIQAFMNLCAELRDCAAVLRNATTSYEATLTKAQRDALQYSQGWRDAKDHSLREQAERTRIKTCQSR